MGFLASAEPTSSRVVELESRRDRAGRRFAPSAELELHPVLRDLAAKLPGAVRGVAVIAEMPGPSGLPDLVAVPITEQLATRINYSCPPLVSWSDARLVSAASVNRPFTDASLARRTGVDPADVRRRVGRLLSMGALLEAPNGCIVRAPEMQPVGRLYALEAKVDDWSGGLGQALRYGAWADASATVVQRLPRDPSKAISQASELGIGLAHNHRWLVRPKLRRLDAARRLWASEHVVAAIAGVHADLPGSGVAHHRPSASA